jgi:Ca2+-binding RTX toxin-like protein
MKRILLASLLVAALSAAAVPATGAFAGSSAEAQATCGGKPATIVFVTVENQATSIDGTHRDDVIVTGAGTEHVRGLGGDDTICTGGENDTIVGGRGDDEMFGQRGRDKLFGRRGLDRALGGAGRDTCGAERERSCER